MRPPRRAGLLLGVLATALSGKGTLRALGFQRPQVLGSLLAESSLIAGVGTGALFHVLGHAIDRDLGGQPALDIPLFALIALALVAAAIIRAASLRR